MSPRGEGVRRRKTRDVNSKLFVGGLSWNTSDQDLMDAFTPFGEVTDAKVITDRDTGRSKGYGFVEMDNDDEAREAINSLNETELDGRTIIVKEARPREDRPSGGGGRRPNRDFNRW